MAPGHRPVKHVERAGDEMAEADVDEARPSEVSRRAEPYGSTEKPYQAGGPRPFDIAEGEQIGEKRKDDCESGYRRTKRVGGPPDGRSRGDDVAEARHARYDVAPGAKQLA